MVQAFVITLREGLEAFLIVAISLAYLRKSGRRELVPAVQWGIALSLLRRVSKRTTSTNGLIASIFSAAESSFLRPTSEVE